MTTLAISEKCGDGRVVVFFGERDDLHAQSSQAPAQGEPGIGSRPATQHHCSLEQNGGSDHDMRSFFDLSEKRLEARFFDLNRNQSRSIENHLLLRVTVGSNAENFLLF